MRAARYARAHCPDAAQALRRYIDVNDDRVRLRAAGADPIDAEGRRFVPRAL